MVIRLSFLLLLFFFYTKANCQEIQLQPAGLEKQIKRFYHERINLSFEIPILHQHYVWKLTGTIQGKEVHKDGIPLNRYDQSLHKMINIETVPIGTEIELSKFMQFHSRIYYAYPFSKEGVNDKYGWISGEFIERAGRK